MFNFLKRPPPTRPPYALLIEQHERGVIVRRVGLDVPFPDAKQMLMEAYEAIERQEAAQQQGKR